MRILVVGCGSVGKRHLGNLLSLGHTAMACDTRPDRLQEVQGRFQGATLFQELKEALESHPDAVFVCTPPSSHMQVAKISLEHACHVFIEKPFSDTLTGVDEVIALARTKKLFLMTGYTYRFWPPLKQVKELLSQGAIGKVLSARIIFSEYLPDWHPWEDYRSFYMSKRTLGGGALLDESHTIDFARWFFGEVQEVFCLNGKISSLEIETDDLAELILRFRNDVVATIHMDLFGRAYKKNVEVMGEEGNIDWDYYRNEVRVYRAREKKWEIYPHAEDRNMMFLEEARHFLECVRGGQNPLIDGEDGKKTLLVILAAMESSKNHRAVKMETVLEPQALFTRREGVAL